MDLDSSTHSDFLKIIWLIKRDKFHFNFHFNFAHYTNVREARGVTINFHSVCSAFQRNVHTGLRESSID